MNFITLLKKDWRVLRTGTIGAAIITLLIYVVFGLSLLSLNHPIRQNDILDALAAAGAIGLVITSIITGMYGSGAFALERHERSADFMAMLPVTRWQILLSKALVTIGLSLIFWLIHCIILGLVSWTASGMRADEFMWFILTLLGVNVLFFGTGWLASSFLGSSVISFAAAVVFSGMILALVGIWIHHHPGRFDQPWPVSRLTNAWSYGVGLISFIGGAIYYPRRIAP